MIDLINGKMCDRVQEHFMKLCHLAEAVCLPYASVVILLLHHSISSDRVEKYTFIVSIFIEAPGKGFR
jgi:hypothetical protein